MNAGRHGPFTVAITFHLTDGDMIAKAEFECPPGEVPTAQDVAEAAEKVRRQVRESAGGHFRWQTRDEFMQEVFSERTGGLTGGMKFAVPGPDEFEAEWAQDAEPA